MIYTVFKVYGFRVYERSVASVRNACPIVPPHLFGGLAADFGRRSGGAADKDLISCWLRV